MPIAQRKVYIGKSVFYKSRLGYHTYQGKVIGITRTMVHLKPTHELDGNGRMMPYSSVIAPWRFEGDLYETLQECQAGPLPSV